MTKILFGIGKLVLFLFLAPIFLVGTTIGFTEFSNAINSIKNVDYYKEVGYKSLNEVNLNINWQELEVYYAEDSAEISTENLMIGESLNYAWASVNHHAIEKHGAKAMLVISCINKNGGILQVKNPKDGRIAVICTIETTDPNWEKYNGKFGVAIFEENSSTVTAFIKERINSPKGLFRYLYNRGYTNGNPYIP